MPSEAYRVFERLLTCAEHSIVVLSKKHPVLPCIRLALASIRWTAKWTTCCKPPAERSPGRCEECIDQQIALSVRLLSISRTRSAHSPTMHQLVCQSLRWQETSISLSLRSNDGSNECSRVQCVMLCGVCPSSYIGLNSLCVFPTGS